MLSPLSANAPSGGPGLRVGCLPPVGPRGLGVTMIVTRLALRTAAGRSPRGLPGAPPGVIRKCSAPLIAGRGSGRHPPVSRRVSQRVFNRWRGARKVCHPSNRAPLRSWTGLLRDFPIGPPRCPLCRFSRFPCWVWPLLSCTVCLNTCSFAGGAWSFTLVGGRSTPFCIRFVMRFLGASTFLSVCSPPLFRVAVRSRCKMLGRAPSTSATTAVLVATGGQSADDLAEVVIDYVEDRAESAPQSSYE